jgi:hypothetical protein
VGTAGVAGGATALAVPLAVALAGADVALGAAEAYPLAAATLGVADAPAAV